MLAVSFTYDSITQQVTLVDTEAASASLYRLVEVTYGQSVLATTIGRGASAIMGSDGVYKLVLQKIVQAGNILTIESQSEIVYHLQLAGSLCKEALLYSKSIHACKQDFRDALCERYKRQKAVLAYQQCNILAADKLLKGDCAC